MWPARIRLFRRSLRMSDSQIREAARAIRNGGVVAYPTEAVFGIGCLPDNVRALTRIMEIKKRDPSKGLIVIGGTFGEISGYLDLPEVPRDFFERMRDFWPGPVTAVLPARSGLPALLTGGRSTLAVRVTAFQPVICLCREAGGALVSTSCNISGRQPFRTAREVLGSFPSGTFDGVLDLPCGGNEKPSRIIDGLSGRILRE